MCGKRTTLLCAHCGIPFASFPSNERKYCSEPCYRAGRAADALARFWDKLDQSGECWLWHGKVNQSGYGMTEVRGRYTMTHRLAYKLANGPIPDGLCVLHRCDVRRCCRPDHLFLGTRVENQADMVSKGRSGRGESHSQAKLTESDVQMIRALGQQGLSQHQIAARFGVTPRYVRSILNGKAWTHVVG